MRVRIAASALALCLILAPAGTTPAQTAKKSRSVASISVRNMRADIRFFSSPLLAGRLSLEPGSDLSAMFIATEFEKAGLQAGNAGSFFQEFPLVQPDRQKTPPVLRIRKAGRTQELSYGEDFRGTFYKRVLLDVPLVFAGYGITAPEYGYDDYAGLNAKGRAVLIFDHEPQENDPRSVFNGTGHTRHANRWQKLHNAVRHGAVAVFIMSEPERKHGSPFDPAPLSAEDGGLGPRASAPSQSIDEADAIPALNVSDRAAAMLAGSADLALWQKAIDTSLRPQSREPGTTVTLQMEEPPLRRGKSLNVVGLLEGKDPRLKAETVIIDAHYDHQGTVGNGFYPGANDNASGTAAVIELARVFARGPRPRRSILFVAFGSEEEGLLGSYYYTEHPLRPLQTTRAVLNLDMIARDEEHIPRSRNVVNIPANTSNLINLVGGFYSPELVKQIRAADRSVDLDLSDKFDHDHDMNVLFRCDHFPFLLKDVPSVWIFAGFHPGYHRTVDTIEKLNFLKLEKVTRLTYLAARRLADSDHPPRFQAAGEPKN